MDPIELRRVNDTMKEPINGKPYTSRSLMACFDAGAKAFGWAQAIETPKSMADGDWLIGYGCATSCYPTQMAPAAARVRLQRDGRVRVKIAGHEIGNGAYTVIGQAAAERLGVPIENVSVVHRRQRSAAGARGWRLQLDRKHLLDRDDGLRSDPAEAVQGA